MNETKISWPSNFIIDFYYYFSTLALIITWFLAPVLFYLILTQSKELKTFKWFLLNHSIWLLAFETAIGLIKPLILTPAPGWFPLGILKDGSFFSTGLATMITFALGTNCITAVTATIVNRYLQVFPSKYTQWLNLKVLIIFSLSYTFLVTIWLTVLSLISVTSNANEISEDAINYDLFFENLNETSLYFFSPKYSTSFTIVSNCFLTFLILIGILTMSIFIFFVQTNQTMSIAKLHRSLIISSTMQILITIVFLLLPLNFIFFNMTFSVSNSSTFTCLLFCLVSSHSIFEFFALFYCVSPYRKFLIELFRKALKIKVNIVSVAPTTSFNV